MTDTAPPSGSIDITGIARRAVSFGLPTVDLHRILVNFALDPRSGEFKAPLNQIHHSRSLADPNDRSVVAMNVDTPYSYAWLDLRSGPVLLTMPPHSAERYMSAQIVDLYTYIVGYVSPRTAGNLGGTYLIRGPSQGRADVPVDGVFECPTDLCLVLVRTELFDDGDMPQVAALQDATTVTALGDRPPPALPDPVATVDVRRPLDLGFLRALTWMFQFMPALPEDRPQRDELSSLDFGNTSPETAMDKPGFGDEVEVGLAQGMADVLDRCATVRSSAELFGSRTFFAGDHLTRAAGAYLGILGNSAEEFLGVGYRADENGRPFTGAHDYAITFAAAGLPPVAAFWSITVYDDTGHLHANELHRYVLGSRQVPTMTRDADHGLTINISHLPPGSDQQSNWLPCPAGPFGLTFRTYLPQAAIRDGGWTAPPVRCLR